MHRRISAFASAHCNNTVLKFAKCQKGTAVVEYSLLAAFVAGGVLSGSSYMSHNAKDGENALLGVFVTASASSSSSSDSQVSSNSDGVLITE